MQSSNLGYRVWAIAMYLMTTGIKGAASMKLHRDLGITQKTAWHLAHRLRESWDKKKAKFEGPVEVDETFIGGKEKNKHAKKKKHPGGGYSGKAVVAGVKDHATGLMLPRFCGRFTIWDSGSFLEPPFEVHG